MKFLVDSNNADLHIHTTYSDGSYDPIEIVSMAIKQKLDCIAITDHNDDKAIETISKKILKRYGLKIIRACEISTIYKNKRVHLLAYGYNPLFSKLVVSKLAFNRDFGKIISLKKACQLIHLFGGKAVIAHPFKYMFDTKELIKDLVEDGDIDGIECIHSYHTQEEIDYLLEICEQYNLYVTAGSDFHSKERKVRDSANQNKLAELIASKSTIEEQLIRAKEKYNIKKR